MFQVPQMNPEKKQTTRFRDFSAGKITDPDTFDLRPEAFDTVKNLRIYHGKLRGFNDVELETVHTTPGVGDVWYAASFLHSRDNAGNIDSTEFLYTIGDGGDWYRYYDDGGWAENSMGLRGAL